MPDFTQSHLNKAIQDKFRVVITTPAILRSRNDHFTRTNSTVDVDTLQISNISISLPSSTIKPTLLPYRGQTPQLTSWSRDPYQSVKFSFKIDNRFNNYFYLWKWQATMNDPLLSTPDNALSDASTESNMSLKLGKLDIDYKKVITSRKYSDYITSINVFGRDEYDKDIIEFKYLNCLPVTLGGFDYNFQQTGEIECSFEFVYSQFDVSLIEIS